VGDLTRDDLWYDLPEAAIAQHPVEPRDAARLLDTRHLADHRFADLPGLLEPGDLVVVNRTRVRAARLVGTRQGTGGSVEVLVLAPVGDDTWEALLRPARRLRPGVVVEFPDGVDAEVVSDPVEGRARVRFRLHGDVDPEAWFDRAGQVPLPPYINRELEDPERYQTIFARTVGSAAAPTAALHFTPAVVDGLAERGVELAEVELEVGLGTFRPVAAERVADHVMHAERFVVPTEAAAAVAACRDRGGRVVAVGTTVLRTLESTAVGGGRIEAGGGSTDLFIVPGFGFRVADLLVTNFHVPGSTLVALVAAVLGDRWRDVYAAALDRGYRFLSFGDAMLAEVPRPDRV
jgi:S-adenosylmethionine:tRNA ribosyltransferase-isomerase